MITQGSKAGPNRLTPRNVPLPSTSRTEPMMSSAIMNPMPMPTASSTDRPTGFLPAKASWRPRMMQFTTMSATKAPSALWMSGTSACSANSAIVTKVAMMRM